MYLFFAVRVLSTVAVVRASVRADPIDYRIAARTRTLNKRWRTTYRGFIASDDHVVVHHGRLELLSATIAMTLVPGK